MIIILSSLPGVDDRSRLLPGSFPPAPPRVPPGQVQPVVSAADDERAYGISRGLSGLVFAADYDGRADLNGGGGKTMNELRQSYKNAASDTC